MWSIGMLVSAILISMLDFHDSFKPRFQMKTRAPMKTHAPMTRAPMKTRAPMLAIHSLQ